MKCSLISVGVLSSLVSLVKGNEGSSFPRDVIAANLKRAVAQKQHSRRKLEDLVVTDECLTALTTLSEDPTFGPLQVEYDTASAAFVESTYMSDCEETDNATTCAYEWTYPQQAEFDSACETAGGTVESFESDLQCEVDGVTTTIDYPPSYACVPVECESEFTDLVDGFNEFLDGLFEEDLGGNCTVGDIGSSAPASSMGTGSPAPTDDIDSTDSPAPADDVDSTDSPAPVSDSGTTDSSTGISSMVMAALVIAGAQAMMMIIL